jgi:glucose-6-phosphate-specific signal transduction histidine kinase
MPEPADKNSMEPQAELKALTDVLLRLEPQALDGMFSRRLRDMRKILEAELARRRQQPPTT